MTEVGRNVVKRRAFIPSPLAPLEDYKIVSATKVDRGAKGTGPVLYGPGPVFNQAL